MPAADMGMRICAVPPLTPFFHMITVARDWNLSFTSQNSISARPSGCVVSATPDSGTAESALRRSFSSFACEQT